MSVYLWFYVGTNNDLDFSLPLVYFLFYCFMRIQCVGDTQDILRILSRIVPTVVSLHVLLVVLQAMGVIPSFHPFFSAGGAFGNPDMLGAYLAVLLPLCYMTREWRIFKTMIVCATVLLLLLLQARTALVAVAFTGVAYLVVSGKMKVKQYRVLDLLASCRIEIEIFITN